MNRLRLRQIPGRKPAWRWNAHNGKLSRGGKGGIDWYRYRKEILLPKLFPFIAKECPPGTIVQEDKAPSHDHHYIHYTYSAYSIEKLFWCGNSPDLNPIEPYWPWMKRFTTRKGAPRNRAAAVKAWQDCWAALSQEQIQAWIERIPAHIEAIIALEGGNEYKEGRQAGRYRCEAPILPRSNENTASN
ncbi:hypothetical protein CI238_12508 [Colletotrichum incanum]|uniref:Tc1-like transposase DDE domain-containing protein n=1 Tax=Colletotrichum incanum TaxID=1573173 RepID=A0A162PP52_COLIC|nr:hypothetical protein CI238_12508 [Colletotrichum incanum]